MKRFRHTRFEGGWRQRLKETDTDAQGARDRKEYGMAKEAATEERTQAALDVHAGSGLTLDGVVVERTKRIVRLKASGEEKPVRSFAFLAGGNVYSLDVWDTRPDYELGKRYALAVKVKSVSYGKVNLNPAVDASRGETSY